MSQFKKKYKQNGKTSEKYCVLPRYYLPLNESRVVGADDDDSKNDSVPPKRLKVIRNVVTI